MVRRTAAVLAAIALAALAACSSPPARTTGAAAIATPPSPSAAPTAPSTAVCAAARALVGGAQPSLAAGGTASVDEQAAYLSGFYTQFLLVFSENGAADPVSEPVEHDVSVLADGYGSLLNALQVADASRASAALEEIVSGLDAMKRDEVAFDAACGIPAVVR